MKERSGRKSPLLDPSTLYTGLVMAVIAMFLEVDASSKDREGKRLEMFTDVRA